MIIRGTTPYHSFILPILADEIDTIWITYCQNEDIIFERSNLEEDENMEIIDLVDLYENASVEELTVVKGVSQKDAERICDYFKRSKDKKEGDFQ